MQYFDLNTCQEFYKRKLKSETNWWHNHEFPRYILWDLFDRENSKTLFGNDEINRNDRLEIHHQYWWEYYSHKLLTLYQSEGFEAVEKYLREYLKIKD